MPSKSINVKGGATYAVSSAAGCTVSVYAPDGTEVQVCEVPANKQAYVTAHGVTMLVSDDNALVTEVFNGAPAAGGDGGGTSPLTPAEQAALGRSVSGTLTNAEVPDATVTTFAIAKNGDTTLNRTEGSESRFSSNMPHDFYATVNHYSASSNYISTIDGDRYTTTVSANRVKVVKRTNGVDTTIVDLHDGVLELNGARARTVGDAYELRRLEQLAYSSATAANALNALQHAVIGSTAEYILPLTTIGRNDDVVIKPSNSGHITAPPGVTSMILAFKGFRSESNVTVTVGCEGDVEVINTPSLALLSRGDNKATEVGSLTYRLPHGEIPNYTLQVAAANASILESLDTLTFGQGVKFYAPNATSFVSTASTPSVVVLGVYLRNSSISRGTVSRKIGGLKVELPQMRASFSFFGPLTAGASAAAEALPLTDPTTQSVLCGVRVQKDVLMHLWSHLPEAAAGATITSCVDADLAHVDAATQELVFDDLELEAAADAVQLKGWSLNLTPIPEILHSI